MNPDDIRERLKQLNDRPRKRVREFRALDEMFDELAAAAVLVPLTELDGRMDVVLTKRSQKLRKHPGQVSFPGGRRDDTDRDLVFTALRESHEEIALQPADVEVYGALMQMPTVTGFEVTVYVGEFSQPYELSPNPAEIDTIIQTPLTDFIDDSLYRQEEAEWGGMKFPMHYLDIQGHNVWGATAYMLVELMDYLTGNR